MAFIHHLMLAMTFIAVQSFPTKNKGNNKMENSHTPRNLNTSCTLNQSIFQVGESTIIDNCTQNCTCVSNGAESVFVCEPLCQVYRKLCNFDDTMERTIFFKEIGRTGCKKCMTTICDGIKPPGFTETVEVKTYTAEDKSVMPGEIDIVFEKKPNQILELN